VNALASKTKPEVRRREDRWGERGIRPSPLLAPCPVRLPARRRRGSALSGLPGVVGGGQADRARAVAGRDRGSFVGEEHAIREVAAGGDRPPCRAAVEAPVDPALAMAAEQAGIGTEIESPVGAEQLVRLAARRSRVSAAGGGRYQAASWKMRASVNRCPARMTDTPCRTGATDQPRREAIGRSRVVNTRPCPCGIRIAVARDCARGRCS